ncbi:MAG TPA: hypothetical protein VIL20_06565 [Sandaracinaceae bacterium]
MSSMGKHEETGVGAALARAIASLRQRLGDPTAAVAVVTPSSVNGTLARRELLGATSFVRVSFVTPAQLHRELAAPGLRRLGLLPEPPGWLRATVGRLIAELDLGPYGVVMRDPGWLPAVVRVLEMLEAGGVGAEELRSLTRTGDLAERASVLARLLEAVAEARARERLFGPAEEARSALEAIESGAAIPANVPRGAVLLGDARNSKLVAGTLRAWLARRAVARIALPTLSELPPAWGGLRACAPDAEELAVAAPAVSVRLVRTPDPVREQTEIVRRVQAAIREGTPLDRIAIVLPDANEVVALREALERAGIPATWQIGPPLASTPAASFLTHALELALGEASVVSWYELLRLPGLKLRVLLGADATRGRGRWRRLLARCGAYRGTGAILAALRATRDELEGVEAEGDRAALESLCRAIERVGSELESWREPRTIGRWARTWLAFVGAFWRTSPEAQQLASLLESWSRADAGPRLSLREASVTLRDALGSTQVLSGALSAAAIRVLSPMQCLGAELDLICVASMTQGRFPVDPSEDPILVDGLVEAINERFDAGLFASADRVALERRRFASVRAAARRELWLSCPRVEMLEGRPLLPGTLLLDIASELAGRRIGFAELEARLEPCGSRSRAFVDRPAEAVGAGEFLLSRLHAKDAAAREAALAALLAHPTAARLACAYRAASRIAAGDRDASLRPWAGFVRPEVLACKGLDGSPLGVAELHELFEDPLSFFVRRVLGARRAPALYEDFDPVRERYVKRVLLEEARALLNDSSARFARELWPRFEAAVETRLERAGMNDEPTAERVRRIGKRLADLLVAAEPLAGPELALESAPLGAELPWRIAGGDGRRAGGVLEWLVDEAPTPKEQESAYGALAQAAALRARGEEVSTLRWVGVDGSVREPKDVQALLDGFFARASLVTEMVAAGAFFGRGPDALRVDAAPELEVAPETWAEWRAS